MAGGEKPDDYTYDKWKAVIEESLKGLTGSKLKDQDDVVGELSKDVAYVFEVVTGEEDHELFSVKISIEMLNKRERKILRIANNEKDDYKDNHAKYERRIVEADTHEEILEYLK